MEQINGGMLEMLKQVAAFRMNPAKAAEPTANGENEFGKLLEQKNTEARGESASGKSDTSAKETAEKEAPKTEKPKAEEEETCDVAREAACAQIVWMIPQANAEEQTAVQELTCDVTAVGEMAAVVGEGAEGIAISLELQMTETGEVVAQETVVAAETGLAPEQTVEAVEEVVTGEIETVENVETVEAGADESAETDETGEIVVTEAPLFKDVEAAPVKVAEAPAQAEAPAMEKQVSDKLVQILESGENRVEIQLNPESLGKMTIELTHNGDGTLSVVLNAENAETRGMLEKHIGNLHEVLANRGQQNVQIEVNRGEESQRQAFQQQDLQDGKNSNHNQQRRQQESSGEDFLQQLRLGLIDLQEES